jgi:hypothetical protein
MPVDPELRQIYERALYAVFFAPELVLRIGEANRRLDRLLESEGATTAAYITASNPRGEEKGELENERANTALLRSIGPYHCFPGEGRDPAGKRAPEKSLLIAGISRAEAEHLGRQFKQNAIVFIEKGKAPELVELV